jgi:hypothetical protein
MHEGLLTSKSYAFHDIGVFYDGDDQPGGFSILLNDARALRSSARVDMRVSLAPRSMPPAPLVYSNRSIRGLRVA